MISRSSLDIQQNYDGISALCKASSEPVYLSKNGVADLVVMDIESFQKREKMLELRENLLAAEEERDTAKNGIGLDELDRRLSTIIDDAKKKLTNSLFLLFENLSQATFGGLFISRRKGVARQFHRLHHIIKGDLILP
jgi:hypothetical protein